MGNRVTVEEILETILSLHLNEILDEPTPMFLLTRAAAMESAPDIVAVDLLGRIHVFEIKAESVNAKTANQLSQYLMRYLFRDGARFVADCWRLRDRLFAQLPRYFAGIYSGERTTIAGGKLVNHHRSADGAEPIGQSRWRRQDEAEKTRRVVDALLVEARRRLATNAASLPTPESLDALASAFRRKQHATTEMPKPLADLEAQIVIWLVGRNIQPDAEKRVLEWRREGVDARVLRMEVRADLSRPEWLLRVQREDFPARRTLTELVCTRAEQLAEGDKAPKLTMNLYAKGSPSGRGQRQNKGQSLDQVSAWLGGKEIKIDNKKAAVPIEAVAPAAKGGKRRKKTTVSEVLAQMDKRDRSVAEILFERAMSAGASLRPASASVPVRVRGTGGRRKWCTLFVVTNAGTIYIAWHDLWSTNTGAPPDVALDYERKLTALLGEQILSSATLGPWKSVHVRELADVNARKVFLSAVDEAIRALRKNG
jgi:hypothetical protein